MATKQYLLTVSDLSKTSTELRAYFDGMPYDSTYKLTVNGSELMAAFRITRTKNLRAYSVTWNWIQVLMERATFNPNETETWELSRFSTLENQYMRIGRAPIR